MHVYTCIKTQIHEYVNGAKLCQSARGVPSSPLARFNSLALFTKRISTPTPIQPYNFLQPFEFQKISPPSKRLYEYTPLLFKFEFFIIL